MLCAPILIYGLSNFDHQKAGKSSLSLSSFLLFLPFLSTNRFPFCFFLPFLLFYSFSLFSSHFPFIFYSFSPFSLHFLLLLEHTTHSVKGGNFLPFSSNQLCGHQISFFIPYSLFPFYDIINYMAQCEPWDSISHSWLIISHSLK